MQLDGRLPRKISLVERENIVVRAHSGAVFPSNASWVAAAAALATTILPTATERSSTKLLNSVLLQSTSDHRKYFPRCPERRRREISFKTAPRASSSGCLVSTMKPSGWKPNQRVQSQKTLLNWTNGEFIFFSTWRARLPPLCLIVWPLFGMYPEKCIDVCVQDEVENVWKLFCFLCLH